MEELEFRRRFFICSILFFLILASLIFFAGPISTAKVWLFGKNNTTVGLSSPPKNGPLNPAIWQHRYKLPQELPCQEVSDFICQFTNEYRVQNNFSPLEIHSELSRMAYAHAKDMADNGYFDHISPDGLTPNDRKGIFYRRLSGCVYENIEKTANISLNSEYIAKELVDGWMNSPLHRANVLNSSLDGFGVGVFSNGNELFAVQNFCSTTAIFNSPIPNTFSAPSSLQLSGTMFKPKQDDNIKVFLKRHFTGIFKADSTREIPVQVKWINDREFEIAAMVEKTGAYELCISVDGHYWPGIPIMVTQ